MIDTGLVVDASTISLRTSGPSTGDIALVVRGAFFPNSGWNDFIIVVLEAWVSSIVRLLQQVSGVERVHFMEGPYAIEIIRLNNGSFQLRALEWPGRVRYVVQVSLLILAESAESAVEGVVTFCRNKGHRSIDLDRLETALDSLRRAIMNP